ncbi:MAG: hypothetical protein NTV56_01000 [Alphaproteobacteria bacterium]|nr:hypothetical protein [Alphaproteobacteria bacterium]
MEDAVDAFRSIVGLMLKWIVYAILAVVLLGVAIAGTVYGYNWYTHDRHVALTSIKLSTDKKDCPDKDYPIQFELFNGSTKPISRIDFYLGARFPTRSSDITNYRKYDTDTIVPPGKRLTGCLALPTFKETVADPRSLVWTTNSITYTFGH